MILLKSAWRDLVQAARSWIRCAEFRMIQEWSLKHLSTDMSWLLNVLNNA